MADELDALKAENEKPRERVAELEAGLQECAEELRVEIAAQYPERGFRPDELRRYKRDMAPVQRAEALLGEGGEGVKKPALPPPPPPPLPRLRPKPVLCQIGWHSTPNTYGQCARCGAGGLRAPLNELPMRPVKQLAQARSRPGLAKPELGRERSEED